MREMEFVGDPDEQYDRIEELVDGPYLELFARTEWPGWMAWGNETPKFPPKRRRSDKELLGEPDSAFEPRPFALPRIRAGISPKNKGRDVSPAARNRGYAIETPSAGTKVAAMSRKGAQRAS